ncbi:MAG TPA: hypothetical protein VI541_00655 [Actinomycetota bacterium]|nr:hypothetical protein [Actinomycetota bacterium]
MTIGTDYLALLYLCQNIFPSSASHALGHVKQLVPQVIELEDEYVALTAVDAGMFPQESDYVSHAHIEYAHLPISCVIDVTLTILRVVFLLIRRPTKSAVVVQLPSFDAPPGKVRRRLTKTAAATPAKNDRAAGGLLYWKHPLLIHASNCREGV